MRCASCRTVFEASISDSERLEGEASPEKMLSPALEPQVPALPIAAPEAQASEPMAQDDLDSLFDQPVTPVENVGQDGIDDRFGAPPEASVPVDALVVASADGSSLDGDQTAAIAAAAAIGAGAGVAAAAQGEEEPQRRRAPPTRGKSGKTQKSMSMTLSVVMAAVIGTFVATTVFRHEIVRLMPSLAPAFETVGLDVNVTGLEIREVNSRIVREDNHDTLEVVGQIANITRARQTIPLMRLSIHTATGQQIYVWTATADRSELGAGEKTQFRRRLASPPKEGEQVMVRFVEKDDIVASIR